MRVKRKPTWHSLFWKWAKRLGPETRWRCKTKADPNLEKDEIATVTYKVEYRRATFRYRPGSEPENTTACHEAVHLLIARLSQVAEKLAADAGDAAKVWVETATEEVVEEITNVLLRAYDEDE